MLGNHLQWLNPASVKYLTPTAVTQLRGQKGLKLHGTFPLVIGNYVCKVVHYEGDVLSKVFVSQSTCLEMF